MLPDYNNLGMAFFHDATNVTEFVRVISNDDDAILHRERLEMLDEIDEGYISMQYDHTDEYVPGNPRSQCLRNNNWAYTAFAVAVGGGAGPDKSPSSSSSSGCASLSSIGGN
jgi:hypothetical protein